MKTFVLPEFRFRAECSMKQSYLQPRFARYDITMLTSDESQISVSFTLDCHRLYLKSYEISVELIQRSGLMTRAYVI